MGVCLYSTDRGLMTVKRWVFLLRFANGSGVHAMVGFFGDVAAVRAALRRAALVLQQRSGEPVE